MRGTAVAYGAITFVNALATGIGAAAGIALPVRATVEVEASGQERREYSDGAGTPLVRATVDASLARFANSRPRRVTVSVDSRIPAARGLKSSSAVSSAVAGAIADALTIPASVEELAELSADTAQRIGLSATGAYDDALAGLRPGLHLTDNARRTELRWLSAPAVPEVILWVPRASHRPSSELRSRFRGHAAEGAAAATSLGDGHWREAMATNTQLVESVMKYDYQSLHGALSAAGAISAGVSGMGPTLAILAPTESLNLVLRALPAGRGDVIVTRFTRTSDHRAERA